MQFIGALNNSADTAKLNLLPTSLNTKLHHGIKVADYSSYLAGLMVEAGR